MLTGRGPVRPRPTAHRPQLAIHQGNSPAQPVPTTRVRGSARWRGTSRPSAGAVASVCACPSVARALRSCARMMRITEISETESVVRRRLEGRLTRTNTAELLAAIEPALAAGKSVLLDLNGLSFADAAAVETL